MPKITSYTDRLREYKQAGAGKVKVIVRPSDGRKFGGTEHKLNFGALASIIFTKRENENLK